MNRLTQLLLAATSATLLASSALAMGPGGPGGGMGLHMMEKLKTELALNDTQKAAWDSIAANTKAAHEQIKTLHTQQKATAKAELANPQPDMAKLAALREQGHVKAQAIMKPIKEQKLAFYQSLSAEQKTKVRDLMVKRMDRAEKMHGHMRGPHGG
jgi:Spy/CpxP family protein refolding chaperone